MTRDEWKNVAIDAMQKCNDMRDDTLIAKHNLGVCQARAEAAEVERDTLYEACEQAEGYLRWLERHGDNTARGVADGLREALAVVDGREV